MLTRHQGYLFVYVQYFSAMNGESGQVGQSASQPGRFFFLRKDKKCGLQFD